MSKPKSNYARKRDYLAAYNRRRQCDELAHLDEPGGRVWGFDFPIGEKPWKK